MNKVYNYTDLFLKLAETTLIPGDIPSSRGDGEAADYSSDLKISSSPAVVMRIILHKLFPTGKGRKELEREHLYSFLKEHRVEDPYDFISGFESGNKQIIHEDVEISFDESNDFILGRKYKAAMDEEFGDPNVE